MKLKRWNTIKIVNWRSRLP
jgi:putative phosphoesterase